MFIHKIYINTARKVYKNTYLFELGIPPLQTQRNNREMETIVQECILNTVRDNIPVESILRAYMDETIEEDVTEEIKEEIIAPPVQENNTPEIINTASNIPNMGSKLSFNDMDTMVSDSGSQELISAPKTDKWLDELSEMRNMQRKLDDENDEDDESLIISTENVPLDVLDLQDMTPQSDIFLGDIEVLG